MPRSSVFISYSHEDGPWLNKLRPFLKVLERDHGLQIWDDTQTKPGAKWKSNIKQALQQSKVAVLLVTQHFLASDFITDEELQHFLRASENEGVTILWVAVSSSTWKRSPVSEFQSVNNPEKPHDDLSPSGLQRELAKIAERILQSAQASGPRNAAASPPDVARDSSEAKQNPELLYGNWPGFVTGVQASLRARAETALTESVPLLERLFPLDPDANQRDVAMLKETVQRNMSQLVEELGRPGSPSPSVAISASNHY